MKTNLSFYDTKTAFSHKTYAELKKANLIFSTLNNPWLFSIGTRLLEYSMRMRIPIDTLVRRTIFNQFCGGTNITNTKRTIIKLSKHNVGSILDFSVEGEKSESGFNKVLNEILNTIDLASQWNNIPFCVFKISGIGSTQLLEKRQRAGNLSAEETEEFKRIESRVNLICRKSYQKRIPILIDAEESWIQVSIDNLTTEMMERYNRERPIVYKTYQLYRKMTLIELVKDLESAQSKGYYIGAKLVRGAYMEKERQRSEAFNYENPIHPNKEATDNAFNQALKFCVEHVDRISIVCGSHNEFSNHFLAKLMSDNRIHHSDNRIWFTQLYGMSDAITFNLARQGYNVAKYVPYGPVRSAIPYLIRRAYENKSINGQSNRELAMIRSELIRRKFEEVEH